MSGRPNHIFSAKKKRQISSFESRVESITRRFSRPIGSGRRNSVSAECSLTMPTNNDRQAAVNGEGIYDDDESAPSDRGSNNGTKSRIRNERVNNVPHGESSVNRQNRGSKNLQSTPELESFAQAADEAVQQFSKSHKAIQTMINLCQKHANEIKEISGLQQRLSELEQECDEKDKLIKKQWEIIDALHQRNSDKDKELAQEKAEIQRDREDVANMKNMFKKEKENSEKKFKDQKAELMDMQKKEIEELRAKQEEKFQDRKRKLEQNMKKLEDDSRKELADLKAEKEKLSKDLAKSEKRIKEQETKLREAKESYDDLQEARKNYKKERDELKDRLEKIETEFGLKSQSMEFYEEKFLSISKTIEKISVQYFKDLNENLDFDTVSKTLKAVDPSFASVPISGSEDSINLRIAHAQRVISSCLCNIIWKPFSSEKTFSHPEYVPPLIQISAALARPDQNGQSSGRGASAFTALAVRGLELSSLDQASLQVAASKEPSSQPLGRAERVVKDVLSTLSSLLLPASVSSFKKELLALAQTAISVWSTAQVDETKIFVEPKLRPESHQEWRSVMFDPPTSPDTNNMEANIQLSTNIVVYTLFPHVMAWKTVAAEPYNGMPGSFPKSEQAPPIEICIHPGIGLSGSSALSIRGKNEVIELEEFAKQTKEKYEKEMNAKRRNSGHIRSNSMVESPPGPLGPIAGWREAGGAMDAVEE